MLFRLFAGLFFVLSCTLLGTAVVAWLRIESAAVGLFAVVPATLGVGSLVIAGGFAAGSPVFILGVTISIALILPIPWILFSFDYIGKENLISPWSTTILAVPVTVGLSATMVIFAGQILPWFPFLSQEQPGGVGVVITSVVELSQWGGILYAGGIVLTGTGLILWSFERYPHLDSTTGTVLCTFGVVPWLSVLFALQLESVSFFVFSGTVAVGFGIGAVAAVALVGPSSLFDRVPAAGNVGPTTVIEELEDAVVVTDGEGHIIELNPSARRLFNRGGDAVSMRISDLFDRTLGELRNGSPVEIKSESRQRLFDTTVSELTDQHDHLLGYAIVLRDVTKTTIRRQRLEVLNRLLRHNLRNDLNVVLGRVNVIRSQTEDTFVLDNLEIIDRTGKGLVDLSEKAQKSEQILDFNTQTPRLIDIESLLEQIFDRVNSSKDAEYQYQGPEEVMIVATQSELRFVLRNLITNAVEHNQSANPKVWVQITDRSEEKNPLEIAVLDNGPGIPEIERKALLSSQETPLEHSAGVGLWTVRWVTRNLGGKISFAEREPSGAVVTLSFPGLPTESAQERQ